MINIEDARESLNDLFLEIPEVDGEDYEAYDLLHEFINEVERLLKHNSIKQVPALFKQKGT